MRLVLALAVFCMGMMAPQAEAARFSGAYLLQLCGLDEKGRELVAGGKIACQAYISGVIDYHNVLRSLKVAPSVDICIPENVTSNELQLIVLNFLHENTEHDAFVAAPAVTMALYGTYPCRK